MNEYNIKYTASPISEIVKVKTVNARNENQAVVVLEFEIGRKVDEVISIDLMV